MRTHIEELFHAVVDLPADVRARYFAEHNIQADMRAEVEGLVTFDSHAPIELESVGRLAVRTLMRLDATELLCGPYRLRRLLGRGGMGTVYLAERADGEVSQQVAVKLLQPGFDDPELRERFLAERQILASLSHPNIARLLDAGRREDGQPYLVMEYVPGEPIDLYTTGLTVREKLTLFLKVCAAVSYLHRNMVVHRDLKPCNILVTDDGEPKLLDFGIAKMLQGVDDGAYTRMPMLTPDYASPEQVNGERITAATDIYSLGALLYTLLTGVTPHHRHHNSPASIALAVSNAIITPPSTHARELKGDVELILLKAMRKEPQERYPSVDALAHDIRCWLACRPLETRSGDLWYRVRKWMRRYWVPAAAAVLVIASLTTGLLIASHERAIAERRFGQLRRLSNRVIDLDRSIRTLPGSVEARQLLVSASLEYLEGLSRDAQGNADLTQEISDGYWRLARIQGVDAEFSLGNSAKANDYLKRASELIEAVLVLRPHDRSALFRSAVIAHDRMIVADMNTQRENTLAEARIAVQRLEAFLLHSDPDKPVRMDGFLRPGDTQQSERSGAATLYVNVALAYVNMHLYDDGIRYARRAEELVRSIQSGQYIAAQALSVLANALRCEGDLDSALITIRHARQLSEEAVYPSPTARLFSLYGVMLREGRILGERESVNLACSAEAVVVLQKVLDMTEDAARMDGRDSAMRLRVGTVARELGDILRDTDPQRALEIYELGLRRLGEMSDNLKVRRQRAELLANSSYCLRRLHRAAEARARIDTALKILKQTGGYPSEVIRLGSHDYTILRALADHEADTGATKEAVHTYDQLLRKVWASKPTPETSLTDAVGLSSVYRGFARVDRLAGRADVAATLDRRRSDLWRNWDARLPNNSFVRRQLSAAHDHV